MRYYYYYFNASPRGQFCENCSKKNVPVGRTTTSSLATGSLVSDACRACVPLPDPLTGHPRYAIQIGGNRNRVNSPLHGSRGSIACQPPRTGIIIMTMYYYYYIIMTHFIYFFFLFVWRSGGWLVDEVNNGEKKELNKCFIFIINIVHVYVYTTRPPPVQSNFFIFILRISNYRTADNGY